MHTDYSRITHMNSLGQNLDKRESVPLRPRTWFALAAWLLALLGWVAWSQWLPPLLAVPVVIAVAVSSVLVCLGTDELKRAIWVVRESFAQGLRDPRETLETMMVLSEHSRRNGLLGLADVETNWQPLAKACYLVATAADDGNIRQEAQVASRAVRLRFDGAIHSLYLASVCVVVTGTCLFVLSKLGDNSSALVGWSALAASLLLVAVALLPAIARLTVARNRELLSLFIAYEGALNILHDNNMESVYRELETYLPGGVSSRGLG